MYLGRAAMLCPAVPMGKGVPQPALLTIRMHYLA
jgi:hypothetical protein